MRSGRVLFRSESGQSTIIIALALVVLCGFAAMAVDIGSVSVEKGQLQTAADLAALAGAQSLPTASAAKSAAVHYAELNGVKTADITATSPYKGNANQIEVVCKQTVNYTFARIFGVQSATVTARAVAEKSGMSGGAFGYTIFSGSQSDLLGMHSSSMNITGSVHSNYKIQMNGSSQTITGNAEAVQSYEANGSTITITGTCQAATITTHGSNINIPNRLTTAASVITMPDFSDTVKTEAQAGGTYYTGNKLYNGGSINVNTDVYVNGDITVSGSSFTGQGIMLATGNIQFNGSSIKTSSDTAVCVYSKNGNIQINGSNIRVDGILYAPNGSIQINGSSIIINGRLIAKQVNLNGSSYQIVSGSGDLACLPGSTIRLVE